MADTATAAKITMPTTMTTKDNSSSSNDTSTNLNRCNNNMKSVITKWIDMISNIISIIMNIYIGYSIFYKGYDNFVSIHIIMTIIWLPTLLLSTFYSDIISSSSFMKSRNVITNNTPPPCSVEYNEYIVKIIGCCVYSMALVLVSLSSNMITQSNNTPMTTTIPTGLYYDRHHIDFIKDSSFYFRLYLGQQAINNNNDIDVKKYNNISSSLLHNMNVTNDDKQRSLNTTTTTFTTSNTDYLLTSLIYMYYSFVLIAAYYRMKTTYTYLFTRKSNFHINDNDNNKKSYVKRIGNKLLFPLPLVMMIVIQQLYSNIITITSNNSNVTSSYYYTIIILINTLFILFILHKLIDYISILNILSIQSSNSKSIATLPALLYDTPFGTLYQQTIFNVDNDIMIDNNKTTSSSIKHSLSHQNVWKLYDKEYDFTSFISIHPGGKESIMLGANRHTNDATALFQSYHPFNIHKAKVLFSKYEIKSSSKQEEIIMADEILVEEIEEEKKTDDIDIVATNVQTTKDHNYPLHIYHENDIFYTILCQRVYETMLFKYNIDLIKDGRATFQRNVWYITLLLSSIALLYAHCTGHIWGSILLGYFGVVLGTLGHDGGHFAVSHTPIINDIAVWGLSLLVNPIMWQHQHTYAHHAFTNDIIHDPDTHHFDGQYDSIIKNFAQWKNMIPNNEYDGTNGDKPEQLDNQSTMILYVYTLLRFCVISLGLCFLRPIQFICDRSMYGRVEWSDRKRYLRTIGLIFHWTIHAFLFLILPFYIYDHIIYSFISIITFYFGSGLLFAFASQVGHLTDYTYETEFTKNNRKQRHVIAQNSWGAEQIEHSNDFCPQSLAIFLIVGGLGLQIEHHLFPGLNHCHLMKIQPIVQEVCIEYNVNYKSYNTWSDAISDCMKFFNTH